MKCCSILSGRRFAFKKRCSRKMRIILRYARGYMKLPVLVATLLICALGCALGLLAFKRLEHMRELQAISDLKREGMTKDEKAISMDLLKEFRAVTARLGLEYFIYSGTLLGSWRHHSMIPWDDDVDVILNVSCQSRLLEALSKLQPKYYVFDSNQVKFKFWSEKSKPHSQYRWKWPYLDIQFYTGNRTHIWDMASEFQKVKLPRKSVFPLHKRPYEGMMLPSPRDSLAVLQLTYPNSLGKCKTWFYSHKIEDSTDDKAEIPCASLKKHFPFVHRKIVKRRMQETLIFDNEIIHVKKVNEPLSSVSEPYSLRRIKTRLN